MGGNTSEMDLPLEHAKRGDSDALSEILARHRGRLRRMVRLRMDQRLQGRMDPSDVVQEAYLEASQRFEDYVKNPAMPLFLWLRFITGQKLLALHRHHFGTQARDVRREASLHQRAVPESSCAAIAELMAGSQTSPSQAAARAELKLCVEKALGSMEPDDREVLTLRHFEQLTNVETAEVLGIRQSAASKRYVRAARRLKDTLACIPGGIENWEADGR